MCNALPILKDHVHYLIDACRTEKHEQQVGGRAHHAVGRYRQDGKYGDKGRKEVEYYCFKSYFHVV